MSEYQGYFCPVSSSVPLSFGFATSCLSVFLSFTSFLSSCSIDKYTLQVSGEQSFLDGDNEMILFKDIRRSVANHNCGAQEQFAMVSPVVVATVCRCQGNSIYSNLFDALRENLFFSDMLYVCVCEREREVRGEHLA